MQIKQTPSFERQLKKLAKKHFPVSVLKACLKALAEQDQAILKRIKDHALKGKWRGYREFHPARYGSYGQIYDSWIVIYQLNDEELVLLLVATGSHEILDQ
ncbi:type II toxin-antitoxin system YafQ family toxin [Oenococcus kitaharae]|uniref:RelE family addiction module toxin n=1 Tax=Oenococcus kitaharae DSM 17330 TaxID=1045004 RepID=G9WJE8_9LACO|nr:type II toxin-antitoxin system YafQ family toxin [Oenococcus kitaharae]EHN58754.1 RelE family addiction module toxin [Oenococcus kitaharae DSM 17330]MCV3296738.1 type II toxin-antitoxin system YafQ family toxin [Oenococcus kitaharae]OEY81897.1 translation repressor RelE [Oenococcus kitaharae]OEY84126.1 translation repressor RelE [Oenococcus kitaharae]OEY85514.1 translation repressor RelE [Oenococcus kitaharae]